MPDDLVEFVDTQVREGKAASRAAVVTRALMRERRRDRTEHDLLALLAERNLPDQDRLDDLAELARRMALD
ncbi:MAG: antitoxin [Acidimicrobiia bacterium]